MVPQQIILKPSIESKLALQCVALRHTLQCFKRVMMNRYYFLWGRRNVQEQKDGRLYSAERKRAEVGTIIPLPLRTLVSSTLRLCRLSYKPRSSCLAMMDNDGSHTYRVNLVVNNDIYLSAMPLNLNPSYLLFIFNNSCWSTRSFALIAHA